MKLLSVTTEDDTIIFQCLIRERNISWIYRFCTEHMKSSNFYASIRTQWNPFIFTKLVFDSIFRYIAIKSYLKAETLH